MFVDARGYLLFIVAGIDRQSLFRGGTLVEATGVLAIRDICFTAGNAVAVLGVS